MDINLDWKSIAGTVAPFAPTIGRVLGAGFGPIGSTIGGIAGDALAAAFNTDPTPEAVGKAIARDPDAGQKLQDLEAQRGQEILAQAQVEIERLKQQSVQFQTQADDTDRARQFTAQLASSNSPLSWGASILATVFTIAFFVLFAMVMTTPLKENNVMMAFVGTLTAGMIQILNYFFGSSVGSKNSADRFASLANLVVEKPNPSPAVVQAITTAAKKK